MSVSSRPSNIIVKTACRSLIQRGNRRRVRHNALKFAVCSQSSAGARRLTAAKIKFQYTRPVEQSSVTPAPRYPGRAMCGAMCVASRAPAHATAQSPLNDYLSGHLLPSAVFMQREQYPNTRPRPPDNMAPARRPSMTSQQHYVMIVATAEICTRRVR